MPKISSYPDGGAVQSGDQFINARGGLNKSMLGSVIGGGGTGGWTEVSASWTYASASTITIPSDGTTVYQKGMKIRFKQGGAYKYYIAQTVAATLLTVLVNTDYTVANSAITDIAFSFVENPFGWPDFFTFNPATWYGVTVGNGTIVAKYKGQGKSILFNIKFTLGSTSAITGEVAFTLPITPSIDNVYMARIEDSGTGLIDARASVVGAIAYIKVVGTAGTYGNLASLSSTVPMTWTTNDSFATIFLFEW